MSDGPAPLRWLTENEADTRADGASPEPLRLWSPFDRTWRALLEEVEERPRWDLVHSDRTAGQVEVECRSRLFGFVDDLTVEVELDENGLTRVHARSASRTGYGDLGVNRRRIRRLFRRLRRRTADGA